jgi:hypothetical protein
MIEYDAPDDRYYEPDPDSYPDEREAYEAMIADSLAAIPAEAAKSYLMRYGDAIDGRVKACFAEADALLRAQHPGPSLTVSLTAVEIMIRFLLLRPLLQGAFLSGEWAEVLLRRIATGRTAEDRELLPAVLRKWEIDIEQYRTPTGKPLWQFLKGTIWPLRDRFVHAFDVVTEEQATEALAGARAFRVDVIGPLAVRLGFSLDKTHRWNLIEKPHGGTEARYPAEDPFLH